MTESKARIRRIFTSEFKLQAVRLVTQKGLSYAEAARQLGLRDVQIRLWKKKFDAEGAKAFPGNGVSTPASTTDGRWRGGESRAA